MFDMLAIIAHARRDTGDEMHQIDVVDVLEHLATAMEAFHREYELAIDREQGQHSVKKRLAEWERVSLLDVASLFFKRLAKVVEERSHMQEGKGKQHIEHRIVYGDRHIQALVAALIQQRQTFACHLDDADAEFVSYNISVPARKVQTLDAIANVLGLHEPDYFSLESIKPAVVEPVG
jgi:hypothetical protein